MLFGAGLPIFFLEMALGQYAGVGPIKIFGRIAPILQGLGYVSACIAKPSFDHNISQSHYVRLW